MFQRLFKPRVHESVALAAIFAASVTLHVAWIVNLLVHRSETVWNWFLLDPDLGPISGMYTKTLITFFVIFVISSLLWRGRDCSHSRDRVFWFLVISIVMFLVMTLPFVYEFQLS